MTEPMYCLDADMGMGHMCVSWDHGPCLAKNSFCEKKGTAFEYKYMVLNDFSDVEEKLRKEFQPFYDKMIKLMTHNYIRKGESWKQCSIAYLLDGAAKQFEDMQDDPFREDYMANLGNYAAMLWWHENLAKSVDCAGERTNG